LSNKESSRAEEDTSEDMLEDAEVELPGIDNKSPNTQLKRLYTLKKSTSTMAELEDAEASGEDHL
jgi:hypothetical protein